MVGDGWPRIPLGDFVTLQRGHDLPDEQRRPGNIPILGSFGITGWHDVARARGPGVTVGRSGASFGVASYSPVDFWPLNTALYVVDFHGNDERYAYYFLKCFDFRSYNSGSAQPSLNRNFIHPVLVDIPPPSEQRAIAHVLGTLDDKIELNRRMNETLESMAQALFKDWFVDFGPTRAKVDATERYLTRDLWSLFPARFNHDSLPVGWRIVCLQDIVEVNPSDELRKGTVSPYLDMAALPTSGPFPDAAILREFTSGMRFRNGDTLFARITPCLENGKTALVQSLPEGVVGWGSTEFVVLRARPPVPAAFTYLLARDPLFRAHAIQSMTGTSGRQRARTEALARYAVCCPNPDVWITFGSTVNPMFERIKANGEESRTLAALRDLLLPKLISGEIRLRDAERAVADVA